MTGRRVVRPNPPEDRLRCEVPELRIVSDDLWEAVATRKARRTVEAPRRAKRAQRIFSGLLRCGACGSGMSLKGKDRSGRERIQCTRSKESGDCPNPRSYYVDEIEQRVLTLLRSELEEPTIIAEALNAYEVEMKRLRASSVSRRAMLESKLAKLSAKADRLNRLLMDGLGDAVRINDELQKVLQQESGCKHELSRIEVPTNVSLHPTARDRYLAAVTRLHEVLGCDGSSDAATTIREVVETVVLYPVGDLKKPPHLASPD